MEPQVAVSHTKKRMLAWPVVSLLGIVLVLTAFVSGYRIGAYQGARTVVPEGEGRVVGVGEVPKELMGDVEFRLFWDVWNEVKDRFYRRPVSDKDLFYGALEGLVRGAGDPYSTFFDPRDTELFNQELEGSFEGVGMEIGIRDGQLQVIAPLPDTPAERAGLMPGDKIYLIDDEDTTEMSLEDAVFNIRGERGTEVVLTIGRDGLTEVEEISVIRDVIEIDSLEWVIRDDGIMYVDMTFFNEDTAALFEEMTQAALRSDVRGLILDLRNNPGGLLNMAAAVAGEWVGSDVVVLEKLQDEERPLVARGNGRLRDIPTIVLVNGGSASASEIVAGALQDYQLATVVGEQTFGKGSVQDYKMLPDGSSLKLTISEWLTPLGRFIHDVGITPDIEVPFTREAFEAGEDPQLDTALAILDGTYEG